MLHYQFFLYFIFQASSYDIFLASKIVIEKINNGFINWSYRNQRWKQVCYWHWSQKRANGFIWGSQERIASTYLNVICMKIKLLKNPVLPIVLYAKFYFGIDPCMNTWMERDIKETMIWDLIKWYALVVKKSLNHKVLLRDTLKNLQFLRLIPLSLS